MLTPGARLGPYEIVAPLGAGGMGEVYRARDTRLGRDVAIKVLPQHLSANPEVRLRFEREAKTVSSLNHPNICVLHDVGREGDVDFLVMELVDGETLAQRLVKGPLPGDDVFRLALQISDALDRAHRAGVIHRDLKPGNIMLTRSGAKLMDFGLARAVGLAGAQSGGSVTMGTLTQSPTAAQPLTAEGTIVGTFQYMAPEQLEGKDLDTRSDLWSFGCVLYEMATGRRAFGGATQASLITSIIRDQPRPMSELAPLTPATLDRVVSQCLAKDPDERWQTAGDLKRALEWSRDPSPVGSARVAAPPVRRGLNWLSLAGALASGAALASLIWIVRAPHPPHPSAAIVDLPAPPGVEQSMEPSGVAISPDGHWLAYVAADSVGGSNLWVRALDSPGARMIPETRLPDHPFWSPDSRWIAYFTTGEVAGLMKVAVDGSAPVRLCDVDWSRGGSWGKNGDILFSPEATGPIRRISANGGAVTLATVLDSTRHETSHRNPCFLPDGDHFVYVALPPTEDGWTLWLGSLHTHSARRIGSAMSAATWVEPGYLLYDHDGRFVARKFDSRRFELVGDVIPLVSSAPRTAEDASRIATGSTNGRIATVRADPLLASLEWLGRDGAPLGRVAMAPDRYIIPILSHDGRRAAMSKLFGRFLVQVFRIDLDRGIITALTSPRGYNAAGCWSHDDRMLALSSVQGGGREEIALLPADGSAPLRRIPTTELQFKSPTSWSPDGGRLLFDQIAAGSGRDVSIVDALRGGTPQPLITGPGNQTAALISPDGRRIAYESDQTGRFEVFLCDLPDGSNRQQLTTDGGSEPHWTRNGREIIYIGTDHRSFYSLPLGPGAEPRPDSARLLFRSRFEVAQNGWDVTADGERILVLAPTATGRPPSTTLIVDWPALIGKR